MKGRCEAWIGLLESFIRSSDLGEIVTGRKLDWVLEKDSRARTRMTWVLPVLIATLLARTPAIMALPTGEDVKLLIAVIHNRDKNSVIEDLVQAGFKFTIIGSTGGFLREGNTTFLIGVQDEEVNAVLDLIKKDCHTRDQMVNVIPPDATAVGGFVASPIQVPVGGAVTFVLDVERFERF